MSIIFACTLEAFKLLHIDISAEALINTFQINRSIALKGIKYYKIQTSKQEYKNMFQQPTDYNDDTLNEKTILSSSPSSILSSKNTNSFPDQEIDEIYNLIHEIMAQFNATKDQTTQVINIYKLFLQNRSSLLNRSRPNSVATGVCKYYITKTNPYFPASEFYAKTTLSSLTLTRIENEVDQILKSQDIKLC